MQHHDFTQTHELPDFYQDKKYCAQCDAYHPYLMSVAKSYCTQCGGEMRLFSSADRQRFDTRLEESRPKKKVGRPRKTDVARSA